VRLRPWRSFAIFNAFANGNVSPSRVIGGPNTTLRSPFTPFVF
jgi:hypothetical protein